MSADLVSRLVSDILEVTQSLMGMYGPILSSLPLEFSLCLYCRHFSCSHPRHHTEAGSDNFLMMALQDNAAKSSASETTSVNHPAQHRGAPAHHHGADGKHAKHENGEKPGNGLGVGDWLARGGNRIEQRMGMHKKGGDGSGQVGYGRPC